ncbi:cholinesterase-like [Tiliqua scincoides]|uniref:cholinesterase-like n=1 Tax=Tiliqua scincoides TaxID=71010 RepID=UPI0034633EA5
MPRLLPSLWCFFILLSQLDFNSASEDDLLVVTSSGPIKGKRVPTGSGTVTAYLGIPYAEPPLGNLRFKKPVPHQPWSDVLEATSFGNACQQKISFGSPFSDMWIAKTALSEDCLFLNLWVPHPQPSTPVPVLVWIHGGSFLAGAASLDLYNGALLAATENIIVASMNYRLGVLGFLYLPPAAPGNMGLWDQHLAMKWVKENAAIFGGDPARLTLLGQSAGAASVGFHLLSPASQPLFAHAVLQSGAPNAPWAWKHPKDALWSAWTLSFLLNCSQQNDSAVVRCLQEKESENEIFSFFSSHFSPTTDGAFLPDEPQKLLLNELPDAKPLLSGVTGDDGSVYVLSIVSDATKDGGFLSWRHLREGVSSMRKALEEDIAEAIALKYSEGGDGPERYRWALAQFARDYFFVCPLVDLAAQMVAAGSPVYIYSFNHHISGSIWDEWMGAAHGSEVPFLFGTLTSVLGANQSSPEGDAALSRRTMRYWAEFARSGNPTGSRHDVVQWPLYNATERHFFPISAVGPQATQASLAQHCDFLAKQTSACKSESRAKVHERVSKIRKT